MSEQERVHPLVESLANAENNWGYGEEETVRCDLCGKRILAADSLPSIYDGVPLCERCHDAELAEPGH